MTRADEPGWDKVHTVADFWGSPATGVADVQGAPHRYARVFDPGLDDWTDLYDVVPLDADGFALEMEAWAIWRRWEDAFHAGEAGLDTHPALPAERPRWQALQAQIDARTSAAPAAPRRLKAEFHGTLRPFAMDVRWTAA